VPRDSRAPVFLVWLKSANEIDRQRRKLRREWLALTPPVHRLNGKESHQYRRVVIGRDPIRSFLAAAEAAVQDHLLAVAPVEDADRRHQRAAITSAIARHAPIDVPGIEAVRTVIAMPTTADRRSDELLAMSALEGLIAFLARWTLLSRTCGCMKFIFSPCRLYGLPSATRVAVRFTVVLDFELVWIMGLVRHLSVSGAMRVSHSSCRGWRLDARCRDEA